MYRLLAFTITLVLSAPALHAQTSYTWNGSDGSWFDAGNWSPLGIPGDEDMALITSGNPNLTRDTTITRLEFSGASFDGDGNLTVTDSLIWSGGDMDGRAFAETAALTIPAGAVLLITGAAEKGLRGRDIFNDGTIIWEGTGNLVVRWPTILDNRAGATVDLRSDAVLTRTNGTLELLNHGVLVKSAGTGTSSFFYPFGRLDNEGTVRVETGRLLLSNGVSAFDADGEGAFEIESGATLQFNQAGYTYGPGSTVTGEGTLLVSGGTAEIGSASMAGLTRVTGGELRFVDQAAASELAEVELVGGSLGGIAEKNINGLLAWTGGALGTRFDREGVVNLLGGVSAEGENDKFFGGGVYNNTATFTWAGTGNLVVNTGGTFNNLQGALFDIRNDAVLTRTNGVLTFVNTGLVTKSGGTGATTLTYPFGPFNNDGEVRVQTGTLNVNVNSSGSTSTDTGAWITEEGTVLQFANHQRTFTTTSSVGGDGTVNLGGATILNRGTVRLGTPLGTLTVQGDYPTPQPEGVLEIDLGGLAPGTEHDVLAVTGTANLAGTLRLLLVDDYAPDIGDAYTILTASSVVGTFTAVEPPEGVTVDVAYGPTDVSVTVTSAPVASALESGLPAVSALHTPFPNPATGAATIAFDLAAAGPVRLAVYDVLGREVAMLEEGERLAARHEVVFDGRGLATGLYLVRMTAEGFTETRRVTLLR